MRCVCFCGAEFHVEPTGTPCPNCGEPAFAPAGWRDELVVDAKGGLNAAIRLNAALSPVVNRQTNPPERTR